MSDNVTSDSGSGGAVFGTDDISSVHYPRHKLIHGVDGTNDGDVSTTNPLPVEITAQAAGGGTSIYRSIDVDETAGGFQVKASAGQVYWYFFWNNATAERWLKWYNATSVTVGSGTPVMTMCLPAEQSGHICFPVPITFSTGIILVCTTGVADNDTGAPGANDVGINIGYA